MKGWAKRAAIACVVLAGLCGMFAATEAMAALGSDRNEWRQHAPSPLFGDPALVLRVLEAQAAALESMRVGRTLTLCALSMACALAAVSAVRLLRPSGLPREPFRRMTGFFCIVSALLRAIDGAQVAVVARRVGSEVGGLLVAPAQTDPATLEQLRQMMPSLMVGAAAMQTALVAGGLLLIGQFFRSKRAREEVAAADAVRH